MNTPHKPARAAFTLIELLMVILVIGLLASLLLVAVNSAIKTAQEAVVRTEIDQLAVGVETFKNEKGTYPATFGYHRREADDARRQRILRTLAKVFPRYSRTYDQMVDDVYDATRHVDPVRFPGGLSIETLDPAESLVFWLGGIPDPNSETKLLGFRSDASQPFSYPIDGTKAIDDPVNVESKLRARQQPYAFDPTRLVDRDNDGWWEYIPKRKATGEMAPYVYFDNGTYDVWPYYPNVLPSPPAGYPTFDVATLTEWNTALPYASDDTAKNIDPSALQPSLRVQWLNSKKFQIIEPGRDGNYGRQVSPSLTAVPALFAEVRLWPSCTVLQEAVSGDPSQGFVRLPDTELDNQTNLSSGKIGDDRP